MKKLIAYFLFAFGFLLFGCFVAAQPSFDMGKVQLTIHPVKPSADAFAGGDYVFSMDNGSPLGLTEVPDATGNYTDITFSGDFNKTGTTINLVCALRIRPSGEGKFILPTDNDPPDNGEITININNDFVLGGGSGQIVVTHYPKATGQFLTGTFSATLNKVGTTENPYLVSGSFKIKRFE